MYVEKQSLYLSYLPEGFKIYLRKDHVRSYNSYVRSIELHPLVFYISLSLVVQMICKTSRCTVA